LHDQHDNALTVKALEDLGFAGIASVNHEDQLILAPDEKFVANLPPLPLDWSGRGLVGLAADAEV
jgi:hypothetical protein